MQITPDNGQTKISFGRAQEKPQNRTETETESRKEKQSENQTKQSTQLVCLIYLYGVYCKSYLHEDRMDPGLWRLESDTRNDS